ncbi:peptide deformylase [Paenibacillus sinopodophylli]|uniref:peptide deformylase n=1 Tax=Paenibacillus sinopodophylli TaxID=1837342 RepID=UPI00110D1DD5|nr:peptide deformylase [Paenibacillus sinopodophylli]
MTIRDVLPFGDPLLRKKARPVEGINSRIVKLLDDMIETLYSQNGAGLAAPQIAVLRRVIVMDCGEGLIELINPEIVESTGEQLGLEACLSYPGFAGEVKRAQTVTVQALDRTGEPFILKGEGFVARCIQHEIDHLNGILFVDHVQAGFLYREDTRQEVNVFDVRRSTYGQ